MKVIHITVKQLALLQSRRPDLFIDATMPDHEAVRAGEHVLIDPVLYKYMFDVVQGSAMQRFISDNQSFRMSAGMPEHVGRDTLVLVWTDTGVLESVKGFGEDVYRFYPPRPLAVRDNWTRVKAEEHFNH